MLNIKALAILGMLGGLVLLIGSAGLSVSTTQADVERLTIELTAAQEVPAPKNKDGRGIAVLAFDTDTLKLTYTVTVTGIDPSTITAAHIHRAQRGVAGPIVYPLTGAAGQTGGISTFQGTIQFKASEVEELFDGGFYMNVHSTQDPAGFIRAQIDDQSQPIPAGARAVDVNMGEFFFQFDRAAVNGNVYLRATNSGKQDHELVFVKLNTDKPLADLLAEDEGPDAPPPEGVEFLGVVAPVKPGQIGNVILEDPIGPGRYAFVCFFPDTADPNGIPHALKGMVSEFTVGGGGAAGGGAGGSGGSVRPPNTGDAGLLGTTTNEAQIMLLVIGGIVLATSLGMFRVAASRK